MAFSENIQLWQFILAQLAVIGGAVVSLTKLYGRVSQLEKDKASIDMALKEARLNSESIKDDVVQIRVSLARIETTLEDLRRRP